MSFMRNVSELRENPLSLAIYGAEEDIADLVESVREHGILTPLLVREDGTIISGHRRFRAARQLGYEAVPCELIAFSSQEEEEIVLIAANKSRQKTAVQLLREGERMKEAVAAQMKKRQLSGLKWNSNSGENSTATVGTNMGPTDGSGGSKALRDWEYSLFLNIIKSKYRVLVGQSGSKNAARTAAALTPVAARQS